MSSRSNRPAAGRSEPDHQRPRFQWTPLAALLVLGGLGTTHTQAATLVVDTPIDAIAFDGFCSLREAMIVVNTQATAVNVGAGAPAAFAEGECLTEFDTVDPNDPFDTITLPAGTFALTLPATPGDGASGGDLLLTRSLTLDGAGPASTIITAGGDGPDSINNRVFDIQAVDGAVMLSDLTVTGGRLAAGAPNGNNAAGIGVFAPGANVVLDNVRITDNHTDGLGGGLRVLQAASVILRNGTRIDNNSAQFGGGVHTEPFALTVNIDGASIDNNIATGACGGLRLANPLVNFGSGTSIADNTAADSNGGGACIDGRNIDPAFTVNLTGTTVRNNTAEVDGGGMHIVSGAVVNIGSGSLIGGNTTNTGSGGGLFIDRDSAVRIASSIVQGNTAANSGGGLFLRDSNATLSDTTVGGNQAQGGNGGGILASDAELGIERSLIGGDSAATANRAQFGGGISANAGANVILLNTTVSGNRADQLFPGLEFAGADLTMFNSTVTANEGAGNAGITFFGAGRTLSVNNSILAGNLGSDDCDFGDDVTLDTNGFNILSSDGCAALAANAPNGTANLLTNDPQLGALADNGGPTLTHASLAFDGPAVDGGDPAGCIDADGGFIATDQRGAPRPQDGDRNGSPRCDIGAFELGGNSPPVAIDDTATVIEDTSEVLLAGLTANDSEPDGDALSITAVRNFSAGGSATLDNGMVIYTPAADFNGTETFDYDVSDGFGGMDSATVTVTVTDDNDPTDNPDPAPGAGGGGGGSMGLWVGLLGLLGLARRYGVRHTRR